MEHKLEQIDISSHKISFPTTEKHSTEIKTSEPWNTFS